MEEIEKEQFDFNDAVLAPLIKQLVEATLEAELDSHITQYVFSGNKNRRNSKTSKTIKSTNGTFELNIPRDRTGSFEPQQNKRWWKVCN